MQVRKMRREKERKRKKEREMCGFSPTPTFQAEIPSCHEKADPRRATRSESCGIHRKRYQGQGRGRWYIVSQADPPTIPSSN